MVFIAFGENERLGSRVNIGWIVLVEAIALIVIFKARKCGNFFVSLRMFVHIFNPCLFFHFIHLLYMLSAKIVQVCAIALGNGSRSEAIFYRVCFSGTCVPR